MAPRAKGWLLTAATLASVFGWLAWPAVRELANEFDPATPCQDRPLVARPTEFHFEPGLVQHRSWIEATVPEPDATGFVLCVDGHLLGTDVGETPVAGRERVSVRTGWVNLQWLTHRLDGYRAPARWQLRYTTYTLQAHGRQ